jgi:hypothetical protein
MIQVSYVSRTSQPMSSEELLALLLECRKNNRAKNVTGMLLYGNGTFLQAIEGEEETIDGLVEIIKSDPRHERFQLLHRKQIEHREYADWSMGFDRVDGESSQDIEGLANFAPDDFNFDYLTGHEPVVDKLLQHYREPHWEQVIGELDAKDRVIRHLEEALKQVRDRAQIARLALEGVTDAARRGESTESLLELCESTLDALRPR